MRTKAGSAERERPRTLTPAVRQSARALTLRPCQMTDTAPARLSTRYEPGPIEAEAARRWEESGSFTPAAQATGKPTFTVMIPPPNVTGVLHMGHALNNTMQDVVVRFHRKRGFETLWLPGTDQ